MVGFLWWRKPFEEQLYRCAEGHIYSVHVSGAETTVEPHDSVEAWLEARTGGEAPARPPFESQHASLLHEFENIEREFARPSAAEARPRTTSRAT